MKGDECLTAVSDTFPKFKMSVFKEGPWYDLWDMRQWSSAFSSRVNYYPHSKHPVLEVFSTYVDFRNNDFL